MIALIVSIVATAVLFVRAGMAGGACHCMTPQFSLFPYGTFLMTRFSSDSWGLFLMADQFPVYVIGVLLVKTARYRIAVALLLVALHFAVASFAFHDYCQRRATCLLRPEPTIHLARMDVASSHATEHVS